MTQMNRLVRCLLGLGLIAGCQAEKVTEGVIRPSLMRASAAPSPVSAALVPDTRADIGSIVGTVYAPDGISLGSGSAVIANNGTGAISNNGGSLTGGAPYFLFAAPAKNRLAKTEVYVGDAGGNAIPGLPSVTTADNGTFSIRGVPPGFTVALIARVTTAAGKAATMTTLARSSPLGVTADITLATTLVTTTLVAGRGDALGDLNTGTYARAVATTEEKLPPQVPDLADHAALIGVMAKLSTETSLLRTDVNDLKSSLAKVVESLEDLKKRVKDLEAQAKTSAS